MAGSLFDINLLLALAWPQHQFHTTASSWFSLHASRGWATCTVTQLGFIRLSCNRNYLRDEAKTPSDACQLLAQLVGHTHHRYLADSRAPVTLSEFHHILGHQQVTDAYLVGLARTSSLKLVTFDRAIASLGNSDVVEILNPRS